MSLQNAGGSHKAHTTPTYIRHTESGLGCHKAAVRRRHPEMRFGRRLGGWFGEGMDAGCVGADERMGRRE